MIWIIIIIIIIINTLFIVCRWIYIVCRWSTASPEGSCEIQYTESYIQYHWLILGGSCCDSSYIHLCVLIPWQGFAVGQHACVMSALYNIHSTLFNTLFLIFLHFMLFLKTLIIINESIVFIYVLFILLHLLVTPFFIVSSVGGP